ncbi:unnamed protein product, partial [Meganyctiphanes norvegica]
GVLFLSCGSALGNPTWRRGSVVHDGDFLRLLDPRTTPASTRITEDLSSHSEKSRNSGLRRSSFRNTARITSQHGESNVSNLRRTSPSSRESEKLNNLPDEQSVSRGERRDTAQPEGSTRTSSQLRTSRVLVQPQGLAVTPRRSSEYVDRNHTQMRNMYLSPNTSRSHTRGDQRIRTEPILQARKIRYSSNRTHVNTENDHLRLYLTHLKNSNKNSELPVNPYRARNSSYLYERAHKPSTNNGLNQVKNKTQIKQPEYNERGTKTNRHINKASPDLTIVEKAVVHDVPIVLTKSKTQSSFSRHRSFPPMSLSHTRQSPPPGVISLDLPESVRLRLEELRRKLFARRLSPAGAGANKIHKLRGVITENSNRRVPHTSTNISSTMIQSTTTPSTITPPNTASS